MEDWKSIQIDGISRIERVAAFYRVESVEKFPYSDGVRVKIMETPHGTFYGKVPMGVLNKQTKEVQWAYGEGKTIQDALHQTLLHLLRLIDENEAEYVEDFVWIDEPYLF